MMRLPLRTLSSTEAESLSMIAQRAIDIPLVGLGDAGRTDQAAAQPSFSVRPLASAPSGTLVEDGLVIQLQWSGAQFLLVLSTLNAAVMLRRLVPQAPFEALAPAWQQGLDHVLARWFCNAIEQLGRGRPDLLSVERRPAGAAVQKLACAFSVQADTDGVGTPNLILEVHSDALGLHLLSGLCSSRTPPESDSALRPVLSQVMRLTLGRTRLPAQAVRRLEVGQLVFIDQAQLTQDHTLWCGLRTHDGREIGFLAHYENLSITLLRGPMENTNPTSAEGMLDSNAQDDSALKEPIAIEDLPVTLSFDCGSITLPLAQVEHLAEGQVLTTPHALNDYVSIRANGAVIGRGVLMEVDGRLAVNITELSSVSRKSPAGPA